MRKKITLLLLVFATMIFAQKIQILDAETSKPVPNARIIAEGHVYYTNADGYSLLKEHSKNLEITTLGYETAKASEWTSNIRLKPMYREIDEVTIVSVDFQKILKDVSSHYGEVYYNKPIIYDVTIKQKLIENNKLKMLMVADGKFWNKDGEYYAKDAFKNNFDSFVQLQIDDLRYLKTENIGNKIVEKKPTMTHDNIGDMFLSYELWRTLGLSKRKNARISGRLLYENGDEQEISYSIKTDSSYVYTGKFIYNKKDRAITHFELDFIQNKAKPRKFKDINGNEVYRQLGDGLITFDYYKKGHKYFPSKMSYKTQGFKIMAGTEVFEYTSERDIIFKNFRETDQKGLEHPVKINEAYWQKLNVSEEKGSVILTKEEEKFINEKYEKTADTD